MRILVTGRGFDDPRKHEVGLFESDQARALQRSGHEVRFAAVDTRSLRRPRPWGCREYDLGGLRVYYAAIPAGAKPEALSEAAQRKAADLLWKKITADGWRPDVIHSHFGAGFLPAAKREGIPWVFTEHSSDANHDDISEKEKRREAAIYPRADRLVCVSSALARRIEAHTGIRPAVISNIADLEAFAVPERKERGRDVFRFVSAGNLIRGKGFDVLIRAFARLESPAELTIIGDGPEEDSLRALAAEQGMGGSVTFTGRLSRREMAEIYGRSDAFVLASEAETFGVVFIEAMACGLPVIATRCGGPEDFVDDSNGLLVPVGDADAIASAMEEMIRRRVSFDDEAVARRVRERYGPEPIAKQLVSLYRPLLAERG